jgi:hypothetical protein
LDVNTTDAALAVPPDVTTAVTGEAAVFSTAARVLAVATALFSDGTKEAR